VDKLAALLDRSAGDAPHNGVGPADNPLGSHSDHRLLHGVEHGCQLLAAALDLVEAVAQAFRGSVEGCFHRGEFIVSRFIQARAQIAVCNAPCESDHAIDARRDAARNPAGQGQGNGQRDKARPKRLKCQPMESLARGGPRWIGRDQAGRDKTAKDELHHHGLEDQKQDEESEQLGKDFGCQIALTRPWEARSDSPRRARFSDSAGSPDRPRFSHECGGHRRRPNVG